MKKTKKRIEKPITLDQWIEIEVKDGKTVTSYYPSNAQIEKKRRDMHPQPDLIYRRLNFIDGVPDDYLWTAPPPENEEFGGLVIYRLSVEHWKEVYAAELTSQHGHVVQARECQPRPEAYGPCTCARCTAKREAQLDQPLAPEPL